MVVLFASCGLVSFLKFCFNLIVFLILGWASRMYVFAENGIKIVVSTYFEKARNGPALSNFMSQKLAQG